LKARDLEEVAQADDLLVQVRDLQAHALDILERAEEVGELRTALAAISQARGNLELLGKLAGELDERPVVNLNVSPEWLENLGRSKSRLWSLTQRRTQPF
jgi:hypothetical protein